MSVSRRSTTSSTFPSNGAATKRCGRYFFPILRAGYSTPASARPELRVLSAGDGSLRDRYQPGHAGTRAPPVPDPVAGGRLYRMDVTALAFQAGSFDAAVATFLFCVLPESLQVPALRELGRVVRPGGLIRLLEYVRPRIPRHLK